ncbi:hypothetical protein PIB30_094009 [Stylosanthes scabra]|uniref:Uncharacterized protein n=1 Tax=Stylosanthes scabra TaxID=79078 RepID=A0ABU6TVV7_9FABA|nr:hypothetical protein [Stylosanthes scabra]
MDHRRKQPASKGKEKLITPPTRASPRLAVMKTPHPPASPVSAAGNLHTPTTGDSRTTKVRRTARISVKPIKRRFSARIAAKGVQSKVTPKEAEVTDITSDNEKDMRDDEAALELTAIDEAFNQEEEEEEDPGEEEEDPKEDPEADIRDHFFDTDRDYADYLAPDDLDPSDSSEGSS